MPGNESEAAGQVDAYLERATVMTVHTAASSGVQRTVRDGLAVRAGGP
jgi:hypothetical protein